MSSGGDLSINFLLLIFLSRSNDCIRLLLRLQNVEFLNQFFSAHFDLKVNQGLLIRRVLIVLSLQACILCADLLIELFLDCNDTLHILSCIFESPVYSLLLSKFLSHFIELLLLLGSDLGWSGCGGFCRSCCCSLCLALVPCCLCWIEVLLRLRCSCFVRRSGLCSGVGSGFGRG